MEQQARPARKPVDKRMVATAAGAVLGLLLVLGVVGWLGVFGATAPCVAAVSQARSLGNEHDDPFAEDVIAAVRDGSLSAPACLVLSVRLRAFGKEGVHVVRETVTQP
jgi:hypothetical protein